MTNEERISVVKRPWSVTGVIKEIVESGTQEDPFYVLDLGEVVARFYHWKKLMPRVDPFYAVKCNDDKLLVSTLAALGAGFDCASKAEIQLVTSLGVEPERIIFANPAKIISHIHYADIAGVYVMTFDSDTELMKIKDHMPNAQLVIRIRCDDTTAQCSHGKKFGCDPIIEAPKLLKLAFMLNLEIVGVSFHIGSGAQDSATFGRAIRFAHELFVLGESIGYKQMRLLDLGGGYPGETNSSIVEISQVINTAIDKYFVDSKIRIIAEPGSYFAAAAYTLATMIYAKRELLSKDDDEETHTLYYMNDGIYGSFSNVILMNQLVSPELLMPNSGKPQPCSLWGPTLDGLDCVLREAMLPPLALGDWLIFRDMGAYTIPIASPFNGFPVPRVRAVVDTALGLQLKDLKPLTELHFIESKRIMGPQKPSLELPLTES